MANKEDEEVSNMINIAINISDLPNFDLLADQINAGVQINMIAETSWPKLKDRLALKEKGSRWMVLLGNEITHVEEVK